MILVLYCIMYRTVLYCMFCTVQLYCTEYVLAGDDPRLPPHWELTRIEILPAQANPSPAEQPCQASRSSQYLMGINPRWSIIKTESTARPGCQNGYGKMEAQSLSTCNQCGKKFQRKAHLLRHQQQRMPPSSYAILSSVMHRSNHASCLQIPATGHIPVNSAPRPSNAGKSLLSQHPPAGPY
jgi:hypothetical protein